MVNLAWSTLQHLTPYMLHVNSWIKSWYSMMSVRSVLPSWKLAAHVMTEGGGGNPYFPESTTRDLSFDYTFTLVLDDVIPLWNCSSMNAAARLQDRGGDGNLGFSAKANYSVQVYIRKFHPGTRWRKSLKMSPYLTLPSLLCQEMARQP